MTIIQIILLLALTLIYVILLAGGKSKALTRLTLLGVYGTLFIFIVFPKEADKVAKLLEIESGKDMIIFLSIASVWLLATVNYIRGKRVERVISKLVRKNALDVLCAKLRAEGVVDDYLQIIKQHTNYTEECRK